MYELLISPEAQQDAVSLPKVIRARVYHVLARLEHWPAVSGAKPLSGKLAGHYRIRTGDYRIQFRVENRRIIVERMGHRDGFYE